MAWLRWSLIYFATDGWLLSTNSAGFIPTIIVLFYNSLCYKVFLVIHFKNKTDSRWVALVRGSWQIFASPEGLSGPAIKRMKYFYCAVSICRTSKHSIKCLCNLHDSMRISTINSIQVEWYSRQNVPLRGALARVCIARQSHWSARSIHSCRLALFLLRRISMNFQLHYITQCRSITCHTEPNPQISRTEVTRIKYQRDIWLIGTRQIGTIQHSSFHQTIYAQTSLC